MSTMTTATTNSYTPIVATDSMADLLLWVRDGDPAAWDEILRRYGSSSPRRCGHFGCRRPMRSTRCR